MVLSVFDIDKLFRIYDHSYNDVRKGQENEYAYNFLNELCQDNLSNITCIKGVIFSSRDMAKNSVLKMSHIQSQGHFAYFQLDLGSATVQIIDTLSTDFSTSPYFCERTFKNLFSFITRVVTGNRSTSYRSLKQTLYSRTSFRQKSNECGITSLMNLILSTENSTTFLTTYSIENYDRSIDNFKSCLRFLLVNGSFPFHSIKIEQ